MSFTSVFKALPEALRHPAGVALIGSFAFHGALFAGAPLLPGSSQAISSERLVRLIQLSPAERNRLPQVSSSTTPIPALPPSDLSSLVLPPLADELPDFSNQPNLGSLNPSSSGPPSVDLSSGQSLPSGSPLSIPKSPKRQDIFPPPSNSNSPTSFPVPSQLPDLPDAPVGNFPGDTPLPPGSAPANSSAAETPELLNQWIASARKVSGDSKLEFQNTTVPFEYPKAACKDRAEGLAFVGVLVRPNGEKAREPELLGTSRSKALDDAAVTAVKNHRFGPTGQYQAFLPSFEYKYSDQVCSESTTPPTTEGSNNSNQPPTNSPTPSNSSQSTPQKISITSVYPKAACAERLQGTTLVAATVKPNSQEAENVRLLSSSKYQTLDEAAVEATKGSKFNSTAQEQNLELNYQFRYSKAACPQEAPSPSQSSTGDSQETTPKSSQKRSSSSERSQDSPAPSSQKKSSQPAQGSSSSEEPAQESSSSEEPASEGSSDSKKPAQESSDEETTAP